MADLTLSLARFASAPRGSVTIQPAGAAITAPAPVYTDTDGTAKPAQCTTLAKSTVTGLAVLGASGTSEYPATVYNGDIDFGSAVLTMGVQYYLSATAGKVCPYGDLVTGNWITQIGYPTSTSVLRLAILVQGQQIP